MTSPIFTITAKNGGEGRLLVHQAVLERSPVFRAMCNKSFKEGASRQIDLPEDDFLQISYLLHFMYTEGLRDFRLLAHKNSDAVTTKQAVSLGAQLYVLADKYKVRALETALSYDIMEMCGPESLHLTLINAARFIYDNVPSLETEFRYHFKMGVYVIFCEKGKLGCSDLEMMKEGGQLAADIFEAQALSFCLK